MGLTHDWYKINKKQQVSLKALLLKSLQILKCTFIQTIGCFATVVISQFFLLYGSITSLMHNVNAAMSHRVRYSRIEVTQQCPAPAMRGPHLWAPARAGSTKPKIVSWWGLDSCRSPLPKNGSECLTQSHKADLQRRQNSNHCDACWESSPFLLESRNLKG